MRKSVAMGVCAVLLLASLNGQSKKDTPDLTLWQGGKITFDASIGLELLGAGSGSALGGGLIAPRLKSGAAAVFSNPAELATITAPQIVLDSRFGVGSGTFGLSGNTLVSNKTLATQTDNFLKDSSIFRYDKVNGFKKYSVVNEGDASLNGEVSSFTAAFPLGKGVVAAIGSSYPLNIALNMHVSDLAMKLRANRVTGSQTITIDILLNLGVTTNLLLQSNVMSAGLGWYAYSGKKGSLSLGVSAKRYDVRAALGLDMPIDGVMSIQKNEAYFNNPDDRAIDFASGETNALYWNAKGDYRDKKWGFVVAANYNATRLIDSALAGLNFSFVYESVPSLTLYDANAVSESYQPVFLVGKMGGKGKDSMQIMIDSLRLSKPNLTRSTHNVFSDKIVLTQPSSLTIGTDVGFGPHTVSFNYVHYFKEFSMNFSDYTLGKKLGSGIKFGADFKFPDRLRGWGWLLVPVRLLYLDVDGLLLQAFASSTGYSNPHYRFGGGAVFGTAIVQGIENKSTAKNLKDALNSPLPTGFALGRQYTIFDRYTIGMMVLGYPDIAMKTSVCVNL
jgi:hypothetical protein